MPQITSTNINAYSSAFHGLLAGIVVLGLLTVLVFEYHQELIFLWSFAVLFACCFGWAFGSWYVPLEGESWLFESCLVTPLVSFLSAVGSGLVYSLASAFSAPAHLPLDPLYVISGGFLIGVYGFVLTLPISIFSGVLVATCLYKFGAYKNAC